MVVVVAVCSSSVALSGTHNYGRNGISLVLDSMKFIILFYFAYNCVACKLFSL